MKIKPVFILALLVSVAIALSNGTGAAAPQGTQAFAILPQGEIPIVQDTVLTQARPDKNGNCALDRPITVGFTGNFAPGHGGQIILSITSDCKVVVEKAIDNQPQHPKGPPSEGITVSPTPQPIGGPSGSVQPGTNKKDLLTALGSQPLPRLNPGDGTHIHRGWVKYTIREQFGITATYVYAEIKYYQDPSPSRVYNGFDPSASCYHSGFPGWQLRQCSSWYYPWGPDEVWIDITGSFYNLPTQVEYTQYAKFTATPYGQSGTCTLTAGSIPPFWSADCQAGLYY